MRRNPVFPNQKMSHYEILQSIEKRHYDRLDTISRQQDELRREIAELDRQARFETDDLQTCQNEMAQYDTDGNALDAKLSQNENLFVCVEFICDTLSGVSYWTIQYQNGMYSFGYVHSGTFHISPEEFMYHDDTIKAISKRESMVSQGDSVMF